MIAYLPQAVKTIKTRETKAISFWMYLFSLIGVIFWLIFGFMVGNYPIIFKNIAVIILGGIVLWIKITHIVGGKEDSRAFKAFKNRSVEILRKCWKNGSAK